MSDPEDAAGWLLMAEAAVQRIEVIRSFLKSGFIDQAPWLERSIFNSVVWLLGTAERRRHVLSWFGQDVCAALLFLSLEQPDTDVQGQMNPTEFFEQGCVALDHATESVECPYISEREKTMCTVILVNMSCGAVVEMSTSCFIQAMYPLLCGNVSVREASPAFVSQANIADGLLFQHPRLAARRKLVALLLDTAVFGRTNGVQSLLQTFLLDDRVERGGTVDAISQVLDLLLRPTLFITLFAGDTTCPFARKQISDEDRIRLLCQQVSELLLLPQLTVATPTTDRGKGGGASPLKALPNESIAERVELFLILFLGRMTSLPRADDAAYQRAYRHFYWANKYLLGPAFSVLKLVNQNSVNSRLLLPLTRLHTLALGSTLTAANGGFVLVWEMTASAIVQMTVAAAKTLGADQFLRSTRTDVSLLKSLIVALTHIQGGCVEEVAYSLAQAVFAPKTTTLRVDFSVGQDGWLVVADDDNDDDLPGWEGSVLPTLLDLLRPQGTHGKLLHAFFLYSCRLAQSQLIQRLDSPALLAHANRSLSAIRFMMAAVDISSIVPVTSLTAIAEICKLLLTLGPSLSRQGVELLSASIHVGEGVLWKDQSVHRELLEQQLRSCIAVIESPDRRTSQTMLGNANECQDDTHESDVQREMKLVNELQQVCEDLQLHAPQDGSAQPLGRDSVSESVNDLVVTMQQYLAKRSYASLAVAMIRLSREIDLEQAKRNSKVTSNDTDKYREECTATSEGPQPLLLLLLQCLYHCQDSTVLSHAVSALAKSMLIGWVSPLGWLQRFVESWHAEPSSKGLWTSLGASPLVQQASDKRFLFAARQLDVLLFVCELDTDGTLCKRFDDECRKRFKFSMADIIVDVTVRRRKDQPSYLVVAGLHVIGQWAVAVFPRVSLEWLTNLAVDAFRFTSEEMCRAAAAAMLSSVVVGLRLRNDISALSDADLETVHRFAQHLVSFRSTHPQVPAAPSKLILGSEDDHDQVIRLHGKIIQDELRRFARNQVSTGDSDVAESVPTQDAQRWSHNPLNLWRSEQVTQMSEHIRRLTLL